MLYVMRKIASLNLLKILARASAGVDENWGLKIKNAPLLGEKCKS
jgi:hypothetical protein